VRNYGGCLVAPPGMGDPTEVRSTNKDEIEIPYLLGDEAEQSTRSTLCETKGHSLL